MIYTDFRGLKLSQLGFGCMRFTNDPTTGDIDYCKVREMFDVAIAGGLNYFDTAYPYLGGKSELAMADALSSRPRDSYFIADKFPGHSLPGPVDNRALFELSLKKCRTDYFDFYLLHNITESTVGAYESPDYRIMDDIARIKQEGRIRHLGFSAHGGADLIDRFLTQYEGLFDFVQIQLNCLDWTFQHAKEKYDVITRHGLGVWVMEPLRGGKLAEALGAERAFRFIQNLPNVKVILSGMNEVSQVQDNLRIFDSLKPLTDAETAQLLKDADALKAGVPCTACRYCCAGCPMELDIPMLLECYNNMKSSPAMSSTMRLDGLAPDKVPSACVRCGACAHACPQKINVPDVLAELAQMYAVAPHWREVSKGRQESIKKDLGMK